MSATESTAASSIKQNGNKSKNGGPASPSASEGGLKGLPSSNNGNNHALDRESNSGDNRLPLRPESSASGSNLSTSKQTSQEGGSASGGGPTSASREFRNSSWDLFGSNNSLSSFSALSFGSLPSLPSIPALLDPSKKGSNTNEPAHRDVTVTATTSNPNAGVTDNGRLVSPLPNSSPLQTSPHLQGPNQRSTRPLPPLQPLPASQQPQPAQQSPQQQQPAPTQQSPQQQASGAGMNALVATQNQNRRIINPVSVPNGQNFVDITEYLNMPQSEAAKKLSIPPSTLSKRWKEAVRNRKWPWRVVCKLDKEIMTLLHNVPQGAPIPEEIEGRLGYLMRKRQEELKPVVIRL